MTRARKILGVGVATLDIVNEVDEYPCEDDEIRARHQTWRRGGNATNTLVVLARLGNRCEWAGTLADDEPGRFILADLAHHGISTEPVLRIAGARTPTSCILVSAGGASRTIVHYRALPEFGFDRFSALDPAAYDWIHFEGRNLQATRAMMQALGTGARPRVSLEVEKPHTGIEHLLPLADVVLFSRRFALSRGWDRAEHLLRAYRQRTGSALLFCPWGESGAWAMTPAGTLHHRPAFRPRRVVDTVGAGDVFNAGVIHALLHGEPTPAALERANRLAGEKCGHRGLAPSETGFEA